MAERWTLRDASDDDWAGIREIINDVVISGETFAMEAHPIDSEARNSWMTAPPGRVVVVEYENGRIAGTANMYQNRPAQGSHIASGSLIVAKWARGHGIGRQLVRDMTDWATRTGFVAIQFNAVVETNTSAVRLYLSEGFIILGTAPGAFIHPRLGAVGLHIMWKDVHVISEHIEGSDAPRTLLDARGVLGATLSEIHKSDS